MENKDNCLIQPIGYLRTDEDEIPRHYSISKLKGKIVLFRQFLPGLKNFQFAQSDKIMVVFLFNKSPKFTSDKFIQQPSNRPEKRGVFFTCSPLRPNPIGVSILKLEKIEANVLWVEGIDMMDGTPIIDIKLWRDNFR